MLVTYKFQGFEAEQRGVIDMQGGQLRQRQKKKLDVPQLFPISSKKVGDLILELGLSSCSIPTKPTNLFPIAIPSTPFYLTPDNRHEHVTLRRD